MTKISLQEYLKMSDAVRIIDDSDETDTGDKLKIYARFCLVLFLRLPRQFTQHLNNRPLLGMN